MRRFIRLSYIIVLLWMAVIFLLSAQPAETSNEMSKGVAEIIIRVIDSVYPLNIETSTVPSWVDTLNNTVREYAHATAYLILAMLLLNAFKRSGVKGFRAYSIAFVLAAVYALTDETHQLFVPGRAFELVDLALDSAGAMVGLVLGIMVVRN